MISEYLSKAERFDCIRSGALAYAGELDATLGPLENVKQADGGILDTADKSVGIAKSLWVLAALSAGIPLGVFGHVMGRRISGKRLKEDELKEKIRLYRNATDEMAAGLGGGM